MFDLLSEYHFYVDSSVVTGTPPTLYNKAITMFFSRFRIKKKLFINSYNLALFSNQQIYKYSILRY